jgi:hypothetical protein
MQKPGMTLKESCDVGGLVFHRKLLDAFKEIEG